MSGSSITATITVVNPKFSSEEIQEFTIRLKDNLKELEGIENISLIPITEAG